MDRLERPTFRSVKEELQELLHRHRDREFGAGDYETIKGWEKEIEKVIREKISGFEASQFRDKCCNWDEGMKFQHYGSRVLRTKQYVEKLIDRLKPEDIDGRKE